MVSRSDPTNAERKKRMRDGRRTKGLVERRIWFTPDVAARLDRVADREGLTRAEAISLLLVDKGC